MDITEGWLFYSADFSVQSSQPWRDGQVMLVRNVESRKQWHRMPDELKESDECPPLYARGSGMTIEEAIHNACVNAKRALPIPIFAQED